MLSLPLLNSIQYALDVLCYEEIYLKVKQYLALDSVLQGRDTIVVLPTGYGKSIIFHLLPFICDYLNISNHSGPNNAVLVISPLNALINYQITILKNCGVEAVVLDVSLLSNKLLRRNSTEDKEDDDHALSCQSKIATDAESKRT